MNIESLRYFNLIAKAGNISSVARKQHITQSALSQKINRLEEDISNQLMERSNKGITLTEAGKIVFKFSESILNSYDSMISDIATNRMNSMIIKVQACSSIADYAVPCTLMLANKEYPSHKYELSSCKSDMIYSNVANNIYDIGFAYRNQEEQAKHKNLVYVKSGQNKIVVACKYGSNIEDKITIEKLMNSCFITLTNDSVITKSVMQKFVDAGYDKNAINCNLEVETLESAKTLVSKDYGFGFFPYISIREEVYKKKFKIVEVEDFNISLDVIMMFQKDHSECIKQFVDWFVSVGKNSFC